MGAINVNTQVITSNEVTSNAPFLLRIQDMKKTDIKFHNSKNLLIQAQKKMPINLKYSHLWILLHNEKSTVYFHHTELELCQLHNRFGHASVARLVKTPQTTEHTEENFKVEK